MRTLEEEVRTGDEGCRRIVDLRNRATLNMSFPRRWTLGDDIHFDQDLPRELKRESVRTGRGGVV